MVNILDLSFFLSTRQCEHAMVRLQETIEVPRPIEDAFFYTSNFANIAQWDPGIAESRFQRMGLTSILDLSTWRE